MKRNLDLIRSLLLKIEESEKGLDSLETALTGYTQDQIDYHLGMLIDAGYVNATCMHTLARKHFYANGLSMQGHDYLDSVRDEGIWKQVKEKLGTVSGGTALAVVQEIASKIILAKLGI